MSFSCDASSARINKCDNIKREQKKITNQQREHMIIGNDLSIKETEFCQRREDKQEKKSEEAQIFERIMENFRKKVKLMQKELSLLWCEFSRLCILNSLFYGVIVQQKYNWEPEFNTKEPNVALVLLITTREISIYLIQLLSIDNKIIQINHTLGLWLNHN